jgi:DNA-binding GntR family transcriptional regulator
MEEDKTTETPPSSLAEDAYYRLKEEIVSGKMTPGASLAEASLAESLGISRTPVREALRRLQTQGLVEIDHGRGARVSAVSFRDVAEAYQIRKLVEPCAARIAVGRMTSELNLRFRGMLDDLTTGSLTSETSVRWRMDRALHDLILETAGNELLRSIVWDLRVRTDRAYHHLADRWMKETRREHIQIIEAILEGDVDAAENLMLQHLTNTELRLSLA